MPQTVSKLGNVYRNSKWSDFRVINVKPSFLWQFSRSLLAILAAIIASQITFYFLFSFSLGAMLTNPSNTWIAIQEWAQYYYLILVFAVYWIYHHTLLQFSNWLDSAFLKIPEKQNPLKYLENNDVAFTTYRELTFQLNLKLITATLLDNDKINLLWNIQRCKLTLNRLETFMNFNDFGRSSLLVRNVDLLHSLMGGKLPMDSAMRIVYMSVLEDTPPKPKQDFSITKRELKYMQTPSTFEFTNPIENVDLHTQRKTYNYSYSFWDIQNLDILPKKILMTNINSNINISKQNKWAWKHNILSDDFILKNTGVTNLKKLMGNSLRSDLATKRSIWLSNKISSSKLFLHLNKSLINSGPLTEFYVKNVHTNKSLKVLDVHEASMFWAAKRFKYTQGLNTNTQFITNSEHGLIKKPVEAPTTNIDFQTLFFFYNTATNMHYLNHSNIEHYNFKHTSTPKDFFLHELHRLNPGTIFIKVLNQHEYLSFFKKTQRLYFSDQLGYNISYALIAPSFNDFSHAYIKSQPDFLDQFFYKKPQNWVKKNYAVDFAEQAIFSIGFNSFFGSHVANTTVFNNNTIITFHNTLDS
jgi:hypothetical protein